LFWCYGSLKLKFKIKIKHESNYHWNKKFGLKLNQLHAFIQNQLSIACVGFIIIQELEWVCMLMDPNWAKVHTMFRWFQCEWPIFEKLPKTTLDFHLSYIIIVVVECCMPIIKWCFVKVIKNI
jgi:hypothetical protein